MDTMIELPAMRRSAELAPNTADADSRTVEVVWSAGARVRRATFFGEPYDEELSLDPAHVRLDRLNAGAPFLKVHELDTLDAVIGSVVPGSARIENGRGIALVRISERADVEPIWRDIQAGHIRAVSIGYQVHRFEVSKPEAARELWRAVDWTPFEVSAVAVGLMGVVMEFLLLRRIYKAPELFQLLATFGLVLVVQDAALLIWGPQDLLGPRAPGLTGATQLFGLRVPVYDLFLIGLEGADVFADENARALGAGAAHGAHGGPVGPALDDVGVLHVQLDEGEHLLPDARHGEEHRRPYLLQVDEHGVEVLGEAHGVAATQRRRHADEPLDDVRERQER